MRGLAWTNEETIMLTRLIEEGYSNGEIAREMGRGIATIENKITDFRLSKSRAKVREFKTAEDYRRSRVPPADVARMSDGRPVADMRKLMAGK